MVLLDRTCFDQVKIPLEGVQVNSLFARAVVEKKVSGTIYVDQPEHPRTFHIVHPYGMSLLFGDTGNDRFNLRLRDYLFNTYRERVREEWLQAYPISWNKLLSAMLGDRLVPAGSNLAGNGLKRIEVNTRVNFKFNLQKYHGFKRSLIPGGYEIVRMDHDLFEKMHGSVVPRFFWDSSDDFIAQGVGFSIVIGNKPVSSAYSAYIIGKQLELGIETIPEYRGKGLALHTCSALIDFCLEKGYEPIWSCRLENTGSYMLAQKLGFDPTITLPYYRLPI